MLAGMSLLAVVAGQPAWVGGRVGPGFMAQGLAVAVILLGLIAAVAGHFDTPSTSETLPAQSQVAGPALAVLGAVAMFVPLSAVAGLVIASAAVASVIGWVAGDRGAGQIAVSAGLGGMAAFVIGALLLPPTAPLWP